MLVIFPFFNLTTAKLYYVGCIIKYVLWLGLNSDFMLILVTKNDYL